jgi:hypothetical protein
MSWPKPSSIYFLLIPLHPPPIYIILSLSMSPKSNERLTNVLFLLCTELGKQGVTKSDVSYGVVGGVEVRRGVVSG